MSVRQLGKALATKLYAESLKPLGFKKRGATLLRQMLAYTEMYNIQGSPWNSGEEPWRFYLNVWLRFSDLGPLQGNPATPTYYHAFGRSDSILPESPPAFDLTADNLPETASELASLIVALSQRLPGIIQPAYERACADLYSPLPVPETWLQPPLVDPA